MQYYDALGLEPRLALDADDLRKRFYERSREAHPDLAGASAEDRMAQLNDAFRTLRNPISRAEYFVRQKGLELSKQAPAELLDEVFEFNILLDAARDGGDRQLLGTTRDMFAAMRDEIDQQLERLFAEFDTHQQFATLEQIVSILSRRRYIANLVRDADKELNVHLSN